MEPWEDSITACGRGSAPPFSLSPPLRRVHLNTWIASHVKCCFNGLLCQLNMPSELGCVLTHAMPRVSSTDAHKKHQLSTPGFQHITWVEIPSEFPQIMETQMPTATRGRRWQWDTGTVTPCGSSWLAGRQAAAARQQKAKEPSYWGAQACLGENSGSGSMKKPASGSVHRRRIILTAIMGPSPRLKSFSAMLNEPRTWKWCSHSSVSFLH